MTLTMLVEGHFREKYNKDKAKRVAA